MRERVKGARRYDSAGRKAQARRSRAEILDTAERMFLDAGYTATTVAAIARDAGVSVETIYKAFGGKPGLVRAIFDRGLIGLGPKPAYERSDEMREAQSDPRTIMENWGELTAEVASVVTPIRQLMRAAAAIDPDLAVVLAESENERLTRMRHHARFLAERGYLREGVTSNHAADILWVCSSVEVYELLVTQRGWSMRKFGQFVAEFMTTALLPESP